MRKNPDSLSFLAMAVAVSVLSGCGKLKSVAEKLKKTGDPPAEAPAGGGEPASRERISNITKADYAGFIARKDAVVIVDFHADWCGPCKLLGPVLIKATEAHPGVIYLGKVDVDQAADLAAEQKVNGIPDVRIFKDGREIDRFVGFPGEQEVMARIAKHAAGVTPAAAAPAAAVEPEVKPFTKDWLPPGMSRKQGAAPKQP